MGTMETLLVLAPLWGMLLAWHRQPSPDRHEARIATSHEPGTSG
jgi:hypothetical protein